MTHENAQSSPAADPRSQLRSEPDAALSQTPPLSVLPDGLPVESAPSLMIPGLLRTAAGWTWLAAVVFAPWAYGCTRPWTIQCLHVLIFTSLGLWLAGSAARLARPRVPPILLAAIGLLLLQGWWMTLNAGFSYDAAFRPQARPHWSASLPGAVDFAAAQPAMIGLTAMLGAVCLACDLGRERLWRRRLWFTLSVTVVSVVLLGLAQKLTHAPGIFWRSEGHAPTFFGPYRYHANAGAFINLTWPFVAAFLVRSFRREDPVRVKALWTTGFILCIAGALANTSRASGLITVLMLGAWAGWGAWRLIRRRSDISDAGPVIAIALLLLAIVLTVVGLGGLDLTLRRWSSVEQEFSRSNSRLMGAKVCMEMLPQSGWFGFGPGTFRTAFPFFNKDTSDATAGIWLQAHQDYLQTLVEWGWVGALFWAVVLPGGLVLVIARLRREPAEAASRRDRLFLVATLAALGSALAHAWGDFPLQIASLQLIVASLTGVLWSQVGSRHIAIGRMALRRRDRRRRRRSRRTEELNPAEAA